MNKCKGVTKRTTKTTQTVTKVVGGKTVTTVETTTVVITRGEDGSESRSTSVETSVSEEAKGACPIVKAPVCASKPKPMPKCVPSGSGAKPAPAVKAPAKIVGTELARQVFDEQNLARTNPKEYAKKVVKVLSYFKGNVIHFPGNPVGLMTNEGPSAYKEAIAFLNKQTALPALKWSPGLAQAAAEHCSDIGPGGIVGHGGTDGSSPHERMERHGRVNSTSGENISFGSGTAESVVMGLIVDDGVHPRGHRANIYSTGFGVCGVGTASHASYRVSCTLDYADAFDSA